MLKKLYTNRAVVRVTAAGAVLVPTLAKAAGEPLDLTATGTAIAGYVGTAATAGLAVAAAIWGVRIIIKAFKAVAK